MLWNYFYEENKWEIWGKVAKDMESLIPNTSKICAVHYERDVTEFIRNVEKVQDLVDKTWEAMARSGGTNKKIG